MGNIPRPPIYRIPLIQLAVLLPLSAAAWYYSATIAYSVLLGGLIHLLPNTVFASRAFSVQGASARQSILLSMGLGQVWKFILTMVAFAAIFIAVKPLNFIAVFSAYIVMFIVHTMALIRLLEK